MRAIVITIMLIGCDAPPRSHDAAPDAAPIGNPSGPCTAMAAAWASCKSGHAHTFASRSESGPHSCSETLGGSDTECTAGCAIEGDVAFGELQPEFSRLMVFRNHAEVLCGETPEAQPGDMCTTKPCLPTRARLDSDGTVAGQTYLTCNGDRCVENAPPSVSGYLQACDSAIVAQYGKPNAVGMYLSSPMACLIAWDDAAQSAASGITRACIGDWMCPAGSLCDDLIPPLGTSSRAPVCKPGPRGTLTASMLSPAP